MNTEVLEQEVAEQPTLEDYAGAINQHHGELQVCNKAFGRLRDICRNLEQLQQDSTLPVALPKITISWPDAEEAIAPFEFDMNLVKTFPEYLAVFSPVFEVIAQAAANTLITSWDHIIKISDSARPIIENAKAQQDASNGN